MDLLEQWAFEMELSYREQKDTIYECIKDLDMRGPSDHDLRSLCKIWWMSLGVIGNSAIFPNKDDIGKIITIAEAVDIDRSIFLACVLYLNDYIESNKQHPEETEPLKLFFVPILLLCPAISNLDSDNIIIKDSTDKEMEKLFECGRNAMREGDRIWRKNIISTVNDYFRSFKKEGK